MSDGSSQLEERRSREPRAGDLWNVVRMSIPLVVATCCRMVMDVTDFWMISETGNSDALAAILPAQIIMFTYIVIGMGMLTIVNTMASQCLGRGDLRSCSAYGWQCVYLSAGFWAVGTVLWPLLPAVFRWAGHAPAIQELETRYAAIAVWTIGPTIAAAGLSSFFNGIHKPSITMMVALEGVVINAAVSYVLIFGKLGFPAMGIEGAAWGTVVGTNYRAVRLIVAMCGRKLHEQFASRDTWRFNWAKTVNILRVGGPSGLQWCSDVTVWAIFTVVLIGTYFGKAHQLATNSAWQYLRISFMPCMGVGMALSSIVGRCIGAGEPWRAVRVTRIAAGIMLSYMVVLSVVYLVCREELIAFFSNDPAVIEIGAKVMLCAVVFQVFDAVGMTYNSALRAAGDTFVPSMVFIVSHWVIVIGGGFAMAEIYPSLGSVGPWIAASVLIIVTGVWMWWRWHRRAWMAIDVFKHDASVVEPATAEEEREKSRIESRELEVEI